MDGASKNRREWGNYGEKPNLAGARVARVVDFSRFPDVRQSMSCEEGMQTKYSHRQHKQSGVVLPIVLIFLVIMMLLGVTAIRNITMEERMAAGARNRHLAFQAAEMALRDCESRVQRGDLNGFKMVAKPEDGQPNVWDTDALWAANSNVVPRAAAEGGTSLFAAPPRCIIEVMGQVPLGSNPSELHDNFRITARGTGASATSSVILQSYIVLL